MKKDKDSVIETIKNIGFPKLVLIFVAGAVLIILSIPSKKNSSVKEETTNVENVQTEYSYIDSLEIKLEQTLKEIEGVGEVEVIITAKDSGEKIVDKNKSNNKNTVEEEDSNGGKRVSKEENMQEDTVLVDGNSPFILKEEVPEIEGMVVIAQGGDSPTIVSQINDALYALFDVPTHKIKVLKKKS